MISLPTLLVGIKGGNITSKKWKKYIGESRLYETNFSGYSNRYDGEGGRILSNPQKKKIQKFAKRDFLSRQF